MHVKFPALVEHPSGRVTKFLALDKILPRRDFLQASEFVHSFEQLELTYPSGMGLPTRHWPKGAYL